MRSISIVINCDACGDEIAEETEGASTVTLIARGEERELELCDDCLYSTFLQEARPVTNRRTRKKTKDKPYFCEVCDKTFGTTRGLSAHQTRASHG